MYIVNHSQEPGRVQSMGLQRVRYDWATSLSLSYVCSSLKELTLAEPFVWDAFSSYAHMPDPLASFHISSEDTSLVALGISWEDKEDQVERTLKR